MTSKLFWQALGVLALGIASAAAYFDLFYGWVGIPIGGAMLLDTVINGNLYR